MKPIIKISIKYLVLFLFFFLCLTFIFTTSRGDTFVNFGFSYALSIGEIPYKDFNLVITPLAPFLYSIGLIFSKSIIIYYLQQALLLTLLFVLLKKFLKNKTPLFLLIMLIPFPLAMTTTIFPGYNFLLFFLLILLFYVEEFKKNDYLAGIILGLIFCTKQTVGIALIIPCFYYLFKDKKKFLKRLIGYLLPIIVLFFYLVTTESLRPFLNLCFQGLLDFGHNNTSINIYYLLIFLSGLTYLIYKIYQNKKDIKLWYTLFFSIVVLPIIDYYHVCLFLLSIFFIIILNLKIKTNLNKYIILGIVSSCVIWLFVTNSYFNGIYIYNFPNFELFIGNKKYINNAKKLLEYVEGKENVIYFMRGSENYFYKIIGSQKIDYFDLPNKGNYGYNGLSKMKEKIDNVHHSYFILDEELLKNQGLYQQYLKELGNYVKKSSNKVKEIGLYSVYYKE